ncbi:hypothetical protein LINPERHAP2_LOCUS39568 [Linum perenne]
MMWATSRLRLYVIVDTQTLKKLKVLVPNTKHIADTIKTKFRQFKGKFHTQLDLMNAPGMGWNPDKSCCECDSEIFAGWMNVCSFTFQLPFQLM